MKLPEYQGDGACSHLDQVRTYHNVAGAQREPSCQVEKTMRKTRRTVAEIALAGLMLFLAIVIVEISPHAAPPSQNVSPEKSDALIK